jgi:hypothetical protein
MEVTPDMQMLTEYCKSLYEDAESIIHRWGHIKRTTRGAVWLVDVWGGTEREQQLAYVAGILHDCVRPITEETCHAQDSAERALTILGHYSEFSPDEVQLIYQTIADHRIPTTWENMVHQSVYLSDKILEHMGAYLDFRAPVWAGELSHTDFTGMEPVEAVIQYYTGASRKFITGVFPSPIKNLVDYQVGWNRAFLEALNTTTSWAMDMVERLFLSGSQKRDFEEILTSFSAKGTKQEKWFKEMNQYITGKKFSYFKTLVC